jgi:hypothetical protein
MTAITIKPERNQAWESVKQMIFRCVNRFVRQFGGDTDEIENVAHLAWLESYEKWDPARGDLGWWTMFRVERCLWKHAAKRDRLNARLLTTPFRREDYSSPAEEYVGESDWLDKRKTMVSSLNGKDAVLDPPARREFDLESLLGAISGEAASAVKLALDVGTDPAVRTEQRKHRTVAALRELGWSAQEILRAFQEVREAISA